MKDLFPGTFGCDGAERTKTGMTVCSNTEGQTGFRLYSRCALALRASFAVRSLCSQSPE
jgi:hypothetical protein